ncbi:MAG: IS1634 family transposase [Desulfobacterales bacterium]|uniref:IS1634 family transposase n=1 Tax=Candidatus Desulfatibia vada TaxID=2841696 RepID=A0A8J6P5B7_9BACT|nr:IS1634 family transposase [Candidatus Desulfatibia vada]MBL6972274.1 IS1634 family transposase [Desulfobacterales bacterium]
MFARIKKSGKYQYLQIVENRKEKGKVKQRVIATIGRMDQLQPKGRVETLIRSLSRFSEKTLLILSGKSDVSADAVKIGPSIIFERLWKETGIKKAIQRLLIDRRFEFNVERAIFLTVLHRLIVSGSDRFCERWRRDYSINGTEQLDLHHLYRAMTFLGEEVEDQKAATPFTPRCNKDLIEESIFFDKRDLFSGLDLVFFDTTSIYFEGQGGTIGKRGFSKDHRPDLNQMVVGAIIDDKGKPVCCEMWPGNTTDVKTLIPITDRVRKRFGINNFCIVADRGMISADTIEELESRHIPYILGTRMRRVNEIKFDVLSRGGRYSEVYLEGLTSKDPAPLKVKEVVHNGKRYIVCMNTRQARKDAADREAIIASLKEQLKKGPKSLVGNKGYRKYLKLDKDSARIDMDKVKYESRFDGKWVLTTNTDLPTEKIALKYKELWQVERVFRDVKTMLHTRPVYHQKDENIRGHVFCSFLALVLRKELERRLNAAGHVFEWSDIKQDLKALQQVTIEENDKRLAIRSECKGVCGKVFQSVGVALPPTIKEV